MFRIPRGGLVGLMLILAMSTTAAASELPRCQGLVATIIGTDAADVLVGTDGADVIVGGGGADRILAGAGDDVVCAGPGDDIVRGGTGNDRLMGGPGHDTLRGGGGDDELHGGRHNDRVIGGPGSDDLDGAAGNDRLNGGAGDDLLRSGVGHDRFIGGSGRDELSGSGLAQGLNGDLTTYAVIVETASGVDALDATIEIDRILGDQRGWTADGTHRFQRVKSAEASMTIHIATPDTVDRQCAPLRTNGWLSCRRGSSVFLNVNRWAGAVPHWTASLADYRAYLVNHEVGHVLGHGHVNCPGAGQPAPVMQQQTKSLQGCTPNGWPAL